MPTSIADGLFRKNKYLFFAAAIQNQNRLDEFECLRSAFVRQSMKEFDAIVVGGGPAGAGFAIGLAREGLAVALLDRARFPRDKACGEFLTPKACELLNDLGAWEEVKKAGANPVRHTLLYGRDGNSARHTPPSGSPVGYGMRRITLDALLLNQARRAGVLVRENFAVRGLLRKDDAENGAICGVTGKNEQNETETITAPLVIGADGSHSLVARHLHLVRPIERLQRVAVVSHWQNVSGDCDTIEMRASGPIVSGLGFPGPDGSANLTFVLPTALASRLAGRAPEFIVEMLEVHFPDLAQRLSGAEMEPKIKTVGCFGHRCKPAIADGVMLIGDAATFIDPFTGEGVYFALRGASLAAEVAAKALKSGKVSQNALRDYPRHRRELTRRYLLLDVIQNVVRTPAVFSQVVARLAARPAAADHLLTILGDMRPPTDALHPAFLWRLLAPVLSEFSGGTGCFQHPGNSGDAR